MNVLRATELCASTGCDETGGDSQSIKCLSHKQEDPSLIPGTHIKSQAHWHPLGTPVLERGLGIS